MKYLKSYENSNPTNGDYVLVNTDIIQGDRLLFRNFINNNVGVVHQSISVDLNWLIKYIIIYPEPPKNIRQFFKHGAILNNKTLGSDIFYYIEVREDKIIKISKDKSELESIIQATKYNL